MGDSSPKTPCLAPDVSDTGIAPICILGMHRSGTSMVAKLLQRAGVYLGEPADLLKANFANVEGFFEHTELMKLNDKLLAAAGGAWDRPPPATDWRSERFAPFRARANLLADSLRQSPPWGWKDPRTSLTIPFWRSAFGPLRFVVVVRNPLEVAFSLKHRDRFPLALGLELWRIYTERILEETAPEERIVTHHDDYFLDPEPEIVRVLGFLELGSQQVTTELRSAASAKLRHHRKSMRDLEEFGVSLELIELYGWMLHEASHPEGEGRDCPVPGTRRPTS